MSSAGGDISRSPFAVSRGRLFLTYGQTNERYCLPSGVETRYEFLMHDHLCRQGYRCIMFVGHRGCYFVDEASLVHAFPGEAANGRQTGPLRHTTGVSLRARRATTKGRRVCIPDAAQASQIVGLLRRLIGDGTVRTAVVFADLNIVTLEANTQLARDLRAYCESELGQLPLDNVNIMIFNIPGEPGEFHRIRGWDYLLPSRGSRRRPLCVPVPFGPPDRGEIASLLFTRCLAGTLEVEWPHWEDMVCQKYIRKFPLFEVLPESQFSRSPCLKVGLRVFIKPQKVINHALKLRAHNIPPLRIEAAESPA